MVLLSALASFNIDVNSVKNLSTGMILDMLNRLNPSKEQEQEVLEGDELMRFLDAM